MFDNTQETPENKPTEDKQNPPTTNSSSQFDTLLSGIRNERGEPKYRSVEDGLKALQHSQEHISNLTRERQQLQDEVNALRAKADEIASLKETVARLTQRQPEPAPRENQLDQEVLAQIVDSRLSFRQQEELKASNQRQVASKLSEVFGDKAKEVFYEKASQLDLPGEELEALAARSPKAVLKMFNIDGDGAHKQPQHSPAQSKFSTENFQGRPSSLIGAETERIPLGGGESHYRNILENSRNMVQELHEQGMSVADLTNPAVYQKYFQKK